jgi:transposase-like protein
MNPAVSGSPQIPAGRRSSHSPRPAPGARPVPCPCCGITSSVRQTSDTGRIQAWACDHCNTDWAFTVPDSRTAALLGDLGAPAQEIGRLRRVLRQVVMLADNAPGLTDEQLRARLLAVAVTIDPGSAL